MQYTFCYSSRDFMIITIPLSIINCEQTRNQFAKFNLKMRLVQQPRFWFRFQGLCPIVLRYNFSWDFQLVWWLLVYFPFFCFCLNWLMLFLTIMRPHKNWWRKIKNWLLLTRATHLEQCWLFFKRWTSGRGGGQGKRRFVMKINKNSINNKATWRAVPKIHG